VTAGRPGRRGWSRDPVPVIDAPRAIADLSDALAQCEEGQLRQYLLYERLTGSRQLWWRCCRDAVQSRPGWLGQGQYLRTLELIRRGEAPPSRGAVFHAAEAVGWVGQALTGGGYEAQPGGFGGPRPPADPQGRSQLMAAAASRWRSSPACPRPHGSAWFPSESTLAEVSPGQRDRVAALLAELEDPGRDPGSAMVAISALLLAGARAHPRRAARVPVVLADRRQLQVQGAAGTLELRDFPAGPPGLFPDPSALRIMHPSARFDAALGVAWAFAEGHRRLDRCVLWRITLDRDAPDYGIDGGSLGAAYAILLWELFRHGPASGPSVLARPRGLFLGLRPRCAVTGTVQLAASGQVRLGAVDHLEAKLQAAQAKNWRLIAPEANRRSDDVRVPDGVHVDWVASVRQADRLARRIRPVRTLLAVLALFALASASIGGAAVLRLSGSASDQRRIATQQRNAAISEQVAAASQNVANLTTSAQLAAVAWRIAPTSQARASMLEVLAQPERVTLAAAGGAQGATALAYSPGANILATGGDDGKLRFWNLATDQQSGSTIVLSRSTIQRTVTGLAFGPAGRLLATGDTDGSLRLWDVATRRQEGQATFGRGVRLFEVAFSPGGRLVAVALSDGTARLWDVVTHQQAGAPIAGASKISTGAPGSTVTAVAFSPDGRILATASDIGVVRLWSVATHRQIGEPITALAGRNAVDSIAFSPHGAILAVTGNGGLVTLWNVATHHQVGRPITATPGGSVTAAVIFSPNGSVLATADSDGTARLWDVATQRQIGPALTATAKTVVNALEFRTASVLATAGDDGTVRLWNLGVFRQMGSPLAAGRGPSPGPRFVGAVFSPWGRLLATSDYDATARLWDLATQRQDGPPIKVAPGVWDVGFVAGGTILLTVGSDNTIRFWSVATHRQIGPPIAPVGPLISIAPDGRAFAIAFAKGTEVGFQLWSVATHRPIGSSTVTGGIGDAGVAALDFSPRGNILAVVDNNGSVRLWNVATRRPVGAPIIGRGLDFDGVYDVAFGAGGTILATSDLSHGVIRLWDVATHQQIGTPIVIDTVIGSMEFGARGSILAVGGEDGSVRLLDVATHQQIGPAIVSAADDFGPAGVAFAPGGRVLATGGNDGKVRLWDVAFPANLEHAVCAIAGTALTRTQWDTYIKSEPYRKVC
jgi:WD40 repeat protein